MYNPNREHLRNNQYGVGIIEYALVLALVVLISVGVAATMKSENFFGTSGSVAPSTLATAQSLLRTLVNSTGWSSKSAAAKTQALEAAFLEAYGGTYPVATVTLPDGTSFHRNVNQANLRWVPIVVNGNEVMMVVSDSATDNVGAVFGVSAYYNGQYYYHAHSTAYSDLVNTVYISDTGSLAPELSSITGTGTANMSNKYWYNAGNSGSGVAGVLSNLTK